MATDLATTAIESPAAMLEKVVVGGDLAKLSPAERLQYYRASCESLGLNPLTRPFDYIMLNGRLTLYARKDATDQLRRIHNVSVSITGREQIGDVYVVTAKASLAQRSDESTGAVTIGSLKGDNLANALMKAETKAKRRVTLSICGLGWLDETETETVPDAQHVPVTENGEIGVERPPAEDQERKQLSAEVKKLCAETGVDRERLRAILSDYGAVALKDLTDGQLENLRGRLEELSSYPEEASGDVER